MKTFLEFIKIFLICLFILAVVMATIIYYSVTGNNNIFAVIPFGFAAVAIIYAFLDDKKAKKMNSQNRCAYCKKPITKENSKNIDETILADQAHKNPIVICDKCVQNAKVRVQLSSVLVVIMGIILIIIGIIVLVIGFVEHDNESKGIGAAGFLTLGLFWGAFAYRYPKGLKNT